MTALIDCKLPKGSNGTCGESRKVSVPEEVHRGVSVPLLFVTKTCLLSLIPWTIARQASLPFSISQRLLKFMFIESIQCNQSISSSDDPFSSCLQSFPASSSFLMSLMSSSHQGVKVLELQLQCQSFHEYSGLISFRINWFNLFAVHGTLKSFL